MAGPLKREVLQAFKNLHRARLTVFKGDDRVLKESRVRINQEFKKNKTIADKNSIHDMVEYANAIATELRTIVVQAEEKAPGVFQLNIRPETEKLENLPFNPDVEIPKRGRSKKVVVSSCSEEGTPCCQQTTPCCREVRDASEVKSSAVK